MPDVFEKRILRARALETQWPFAADLLRFYRGLMASQRRFFEHAPVADPDRDRFTKEFMADLESLLEGVAADGPRLLAEEARRWKEDVPKAWWKEHSRPHPPLESCGGCLSPLYHFVLLVGDPAYRLRARLDAGETAPPAGDPSGACPFCEHAPAVAVLREDKAAETVRRSLVCSLCSLEWEYPRVMCPSCGEEKPEKLPRYTAQEIPWMRVEACDSCGKYLKSVDLTLNWEAEPVVDELGSTPLDIIAREHGYQKIVPNLAGL